MKSDVDVLGSGVVLVIFGECNCQLVIREQSGGVEGGVKELRYEGSKPEGFLGCVSSHYIYSLSVVDSEIISCLLAVQETAPPWSKNA